MLKFGIGRAMAGMQSVGLWIKLSLLCSVMLVPLVGLLAMQFAQSLAALQRVDLRMQGQAVVAQLVRLESRLLAGVDAQLVQQTAGELAHLPAQDLMPIWQRVQPRLADMGPATPEADRHVVRADLRTLMLRVARGSGGLQAATAQEAMRLALMSELLPGLEQGVLRLSFFLTPGMLPDIDGGERDALWRQIAALQEDIGTTDARYDILMESSNSNYTTWTSARAETKAYLRAADAALRDQDGPAGQQDLRPQAERAMQLLHSAMASLADAQQAALMAERDAARQSLVLWSALTALIAVTLLVVATLLRRSLGQQLALLRSNIRAIAEGNLGRAQPVPGRDEFAALGRLVDRMGQRMSSMVAEIRTSAVRVREAGTSVASEALSLSARNERQTEQLVSAAQHVSRLDTDVQQTGQSAADLDQICRRLQERAQEGAEAMRQANEGVNALQDSARRVAEINGVIDDIAFQTNLVALNASVEAARAGDSGRGFSVVAAEIRQLAQRCVESAGQVRELIEQTSDHVQTSAERILLVGQSLDGLGEGIQSMAQRVQSIEHTAQRQQQALVDVGQGVETSQAVNLENAQTVLATETAARSMLGQAESLQASVAAFRLRQGTADEARALVERARQRITEIGWERAVEEFQRPDGEFLDRDLYLYAFDAEGRYLACGNDPGRVGKLVHDMPGVSAAMAEHLVSAGRAAGEAGGGWIEYEFATADLSGESRKSAWVVGLGDGAFLGCGVYRGEVTPNPGAREAQTDDTLALQPA